MREERRAAARRLPRRPFRAGQRTSACRAQQSAELAVAEVKAHLEAADLVPLEKQHGDTSRPPARRAAGLSHRSCMAKTGDDKGILGYKMPSGNGSSGGHASGRGAPLEPTRPTGQVRFGRRRHEAETPRPCAASASLCRRRRAAESACFRASVGVALARPSRREGRFSPDEADRRGRPSPSGPVVETFSASRSSRSSADRGVLWTGIEPVTPRL